MSIQTCPLCAGCGTVYVWVDIPQDYHVWDYHKVSMPVVERRRQTCPDCGGGGKFRPKGQAFTPLEQMPIEILQDLAKIIPFVRLDEEKGWLQFVGNPGLILDDDLLLLLKKTSSIGRVFEENNWLVSY